MKRIFIVWILIRPYSTSNLKNLLFQVVVNNYFTKELQLLPVLKIWNLILRSMFLYFWERNSRKLDSSNFNFYNELLENKNKFYLSKNFSSIVANLKIKKKKHIFSNFLTGIRDFPIWISNTSIIITFSLSFLY